MIYSVFHYTKTIYFYPGMWVDQRNYPGVYGKLQHAGFITSIHPSSMVTCSYTPVINGYEMQSKIY